MQKQVESLLILLICFLALTGCTQKLVRISNLNDLDGAKIGVYTGSEYDTIVKEKIKDGIVTYYNNYNDQISALKAGKIDGFLVDEPLAKEILKNSKGLRILEGRLTEDSYALAISPNKKNLLEEINDVIESMKQDRTMDEIAEKWFGNDESKKVLLNYSYDDSRGTIKFATVSGSAPFAYVKDNKNVGYDIEVIMYICKVLGYKLELVEMDFAGIIPALVSNKVDVAGCSIIVTEERKKSVLFAEPDYTGGIVVVVRDE
jgi:polar amino acid transport system substrate-binding protein